MGILDRFRQKKEVGKKEKSREEMLLDIASAISYGDMEIVSEMEECISDTERYFKNHCEYYEARGIRDAANEDLIQWMTLVDILVQHGYVCELNWKCGRHGFTYFMKQLSTTKSEKLQVIEEWFREEGNVPEWCHMLDEQWKNKGMCVAAMEIDGDSYILFPYLNVLLAGLSKTAEKIGHRIYKC